MRRNLWNVLFGLFVLLFVVGCAPMRPPSVSAFMDAYQGCSDSSRNAGSLSVTKYLAFSSDSARYVQSENDSSAIVNILDRELAFSFEFNYYHFFKHFELGVGLQIINPYFTMGFASDHFGAMAWTDFTLFNVFYNEMGKTNWGVSVAEQFPLSSWFRLGLIQFVSRTRISWEDLDSIDPDGRIDREHSAKRADFTEFGGGTYFTYETGFGLRWGLEFRYSYDITYKANRFAFTLNLLGMDDALKKLTQDR